MKFATVLFMVTVSDKENFDKFRPMEYKWPIIIIIIIILTFSQRNQKQSLFKLFQWFGNMVTMKWWDDLWLNEGFASTLMYFAMDNAYPEWNIVSCESVKIVRNASRILHTLWYKILI